MALATSFDQRSPHRLLVDLGAVGVGDQAADFLGAWRDAAVHFAGAEHGMRRAVLAGAAVDVAGLRQVDGDAAGDAAERLAPADDAGDGLLVHAVLQRHDVAVRRQILLDHHGGPGGVVGLHADKGDVDRRLLGELLRVGDVQRADGNGEFRDVHGVGDAQAVLAHVLDMLGPRIDEGDVLARLHHMGAGIAADRARTNDGYFPTHAFLPGFLVRELARQRGGSQMVQCAGRRRYLPPIRAVFNGIDRIDISLANQLSLRQRSPGKLTMLMWTDRLDAKLLKLKKDGLSFAEIAEQMGITRNAALGRFQRLNGVVFPSQLERRRSRAAAAKAQERRPPPKGGGDYSEDESRHRRRDRQGQGDEVRLTSPAPPIVAIGDVFGISQCAGLPDRDGTEKARGKSTCPDRRGLSRSSSRPGLMDSGFAGCDTRIPCKSQPRHCLTSPSPNCSSCRRARTFTALRASPSIPRATSSSSIAGRCR